MCEEGFQVVMLLPVPLWYLCMQNG